MPLLRVISYNAIENYHLCIDAEDKERRVDLLIDLGSSCANAEILVGKSVEVDSLSAYIEIAAGCRVIG